MSRYDRPSHRAFMTFFYRAGWQVQFTEADLKTPLPRTFTFADPEKIRELGRRGEAMGTSEARWTPDKRSLAAIYDVPPHAPREVLGSNSFANGMAEAAVHSYYPRVCDDSLQVF